MLFSAGLSLIYDVWPKPVCPVLLRLHLRDLHDLQQRGWHRLHGSLPAARAHQCHDGTGCRTSPRFVSRRKTASSAEHRKHANKWQILHHSIILVPVGKKIPLFGWPSSKLSFSRDEEQEATSDCSHSYLAQRSLIGGFVCISLGDFRVKLCWILHFRRQVRERGEKAKTRRSSSAPICTEKWLGVQFFPWFFLAVIQEAWLKELIILPVTGTFPLVVFLTMSLFLCSWS